MIGRLEVRLPISAFDAINPAFHHVKQQLLKPFRFGQWVRLAFVGLLAGEMSSGGGCNSSINIPNTHRQEGSEQLLNGAGALRLPHFPALSAELIVFLVLAGLCFLVLVIYVSSMMRFILFDSVVAKECHIRQGWTRRKSNGFDLFVWQIGLTLVSAAAFVILIGIPVAAAWAFGLLENPRAHLISLVLGGIALFFVMIALILLLGVVHVLTKDFVVPQMALEDISATKGWSRLWQLLIAEKGGYAGYVVTKIVLAIGVGILFGVITIILMLVTLLPIGGMGVVAVLMGKAAGLTWNFYTISLAVVVGCMVFAFLIFLISFICVPATVFFPAYSIYFFAERYPPLAGYLELQPKLAVPPMPPTSNPQPLPPTA